MPFPDEPFAFQVEIVPYRPDWAVGGQGLVALLRRLLPSATATDHIGSTSVPGLPAKDCLDAMVRVESLAAADLSALSEEGYRERPEEWNHAGVLGGNTYPKRVFAPPAGVRSVNVHVREMGSETARHALLFRDFLRADSGTRDVWGGFKVRTAEANPDVYAYGQVKASVQPLLMALVEHWADGNSWQPS